MLIHVLVVVVVVVIGCLQPLLVTDPDTGTTYYCLDAGCIVSGCPRRRSPRGTSLLLVSVAAACIRSVPYSTYGRIFLGAHAASRWLPNVAVCSTRMTPFYEAHCLS